MHNMSSIVSYNKILSRFRDDYNRGLDWSMDLLTTYTDDSELQVITALSLIYTLYKSLQHTLSLSLSYSYLVVAW
jgi:hypothetical protein